MATKSVHPRGDNEGSLGVAAYRWATAFIAGVLSNGTESKTIKQIADEVDASASHRGSASGHADVITNSAARHTAGTDQGLDTGGANAVTAAQAKAGYTHSGVTTGNPHSVDITDIAENATLHYNHLGTAFPGAPSAGDLFYHQTVDILFQYENSVWNPLFGYSADLQLYVNATSGSDAVGQGFASGADACATWQYCIDKCIPATSYGDVTVNATAESYDETATLGGKKVIGDFEITLAPSPNWSLR